MKFGGLEPRRYEDIKEIVAPQIDPKSFGTFEKQAPGRYFSNFILALQGKLPWQHCNFTC